MENIINEMTDTLRVNSLIQGYTDINQNRIELFNKNNSRFYIPDMTKLAGVSTGFETLFSNKE